MIELNNIARKYTTGAIDFYALKDVSLQIETGEIVVILGPSGSGKSTLLNLVGGIDRPSSGQIEIDGEDLASLDEGALTRYRRNKIGFIFQFYNMIPNLTVGENIEVAGHIGHNALSLDAVLERVALADKKNKFPHELSGGEQQRVSIARAIIKRPAILLCDEPTGSLDYQASRQVLALLAEINHQDHTTLLIVTHNTAIAAMADRIIRLRSGEVIESYLNPSRIEAKDVTW
jgi:putative ABC transport system ATP-binding protein